MSRRVIGTKTFDALEGEARENAIANARHYVRDDANWWTSAFGIDSLAPRFSQAGAAFRLNEDGQRRLHWRDKEAFRWSYEQWEDCENLALFDITFDESALQFSASVKLGTFLRFRGLDTQCADLIAMESEQGGDTAVRVGGSIQCGDSGMVASIYTFGRKMTERERQQRRIAQQSLKDWADDMACWMLEQIMGEDEYWQEDENVITYIEDNEFHFDDNGRIDFWYGY